MAESTASNSLTPFLRSRIGALRVTNIVTRYNLASDGALILCPRLAWAAGLAEFEEIDIRNVTRRSRQAAYVVFGQIAKAELWTSEETPTQIGDVIRITAYAWLHAETKPEHVVHIVRVSRENSPLEIRRVTARRVPREPSFFPLPPRRETVTPTAVTPVPGTDQSLID